jgi:hypothetical protein
VALASWAAALTLPALHSYATNPSPAYAALRELQRLAQPPTRFALGAHYVYLPYLDEASLAGVDRLISAKPGTAVARLREFWIGGGRKDVLFVAQPGRTDLESIDLRSRRSIGDWRWPFEGRFLTGARPIAAELLRISPPGFFAGPGFLLSLEAGRPSELPRVLERRAWLRALGEPTFLILAGEPIGPAAQHQLELSLEGRTLYEHACGDPLLRGVLLPARDDAGRYVELLARTRRLGKPEGVCRFALRGLDYGKVADAGYAHGAGWFYPEPDERKRVFRWVGARARTLLHVPERGARLTLEAVAPLEYVGVGGRLRLFVDGQPLLERTLDRRAVSFDVELPEGPAFRELTLESERSFVPDRVQKNGDRRRLALRVYGFRLAPL